MLNEHGALANMIELYTYEKGKIKTASVVSFGLKPLIKFDLDKMIHFIVFGIMKIKGVTRS